MTGRHDSIASFRLDDSASCSVHDTVLHLIDDGMLEGLDDASLHAVIDRYVKGCTQAQALNSEHTSPIQRFLTLGLQHHDL